MASPEAKEEIREYDIPVRLEDHIEELRKRVLYILLGAIIAFCNGSKNLKRVCMCKVRYEWAALVQ
jgi:hypothetical protein